MRQRFRDVSICLVLLVTIAGAEEPAPVRLALQWLPQSQFAGYYMAQKRGFYRDAGLDVTIIHAGPGPSSADFLGRDQADFATMFLSDALVLRDQGLELCLLAQIVNRSNLMLVAWSAPGITDPSALDGQPVSLWHGSFSVAFETFFHQQRIQPVTLPQHYTVNLFLRRGVVACAAMEYNEYHRIYQAGIDYEQLTVFLMRDYGLGFVEDGLYCLVPYRRRFPERCAAMREATLAGWRYAREHPQETLDAVLEESRKAEVPANRPHARWMLEHILAAVFPNGGEREFGELCRDDYNRAVGSLRDAGRIDRALKIETFTDREAQ